MLNANRFAETLSDTQAAEVDRWWHGLAPRDRRELRRDPGRPLLRVVARFVEAGEDVEPTTLDDPAQLAFLGETLSAPFFTADVARLAGGGWTVIEINDGGSSSFPEQLDPRDFYRPVLASRG